MTSLPYAGPTKRKYRNTPVTVEGVRYASKKEAKRAAELRLLERHGKISDLRFQPRFPLIVNGDLVATYVGDMSYVENNRLVVEDVKGILTDVFKLKAKLFRAIHGFEITVT